MKLKPNYQNTVVTIVKTGRKISASDLEARPRLHCKVYNVYHCFDFENEAEKEAVKQLTIEQAKELDAKEFEEKEARFLASLESAKNKVTTKKEKLKDNTEENGNIETT